MGENGYTQTDMMICSKSLDQNTLINTLIKNISSDPNHKGEKTIKITQHNYGAKNTPEQQPRSYGAGQRQAVTGGSPGHSVAGIPIINDEISEEVTKEETTEDQGKDQGEKPSHQISPEADSSPETVKDLDKTIEKHSEVGIPISIDEIIEKVVAHEDGESLRQNPPRKNREEVGEKRPVWTVSERLSFFGFSDSDDE